MLVAKNSSLRDDFFKQVEEFYSPNYVMVELFEHKEELLAHSKLAETEIYELLHKIFARVNFVSDYAVAQKNKLKAHKLCKGVDEDDAPILALVLELNARLWTNDRRLKRGLRKQGFKKFFIPKGK
jgi:predicted nucleic acid-binding protein